LRSNKTLGALNSNPDAEICSNGELYLVYYVTIQNDEKILLGHTRVSANANGFIADCNRHITFAFAAEDKRGIPTPKNSLAQYGTILASTLFPKFSWTPINSAAGTIASFVNVDPKSIDVRNNVAELALQRMVDNICVAAVANYASSAPTASPPPTPSPAPSNAPRDVPGGRPDTVPGTIPAAAGPASAPATGLDLATFTGPEPYAVTCNDTAVNALHVEPVKGNAYTGLLDRWKTPPQQTPSPKP
jgi:hypothetical protein